MIITASTLQTVSVTGYAKYQQPVSEIAVQQRPAWHEMLSQSTDHRELASHRVPSH